MSLHVSLTNWEFTVICLMIFLGYCFYQYKQSQRYEAQARNYGFSRKGQVTEIHNHFYGYDEKQIAGIQQIQAQAQMRGIPITTHVQPVYQVNNSDMENHDLIKEHEINLTSDDLGLDEEGKEVILVPESIDSPKVVPIRKEVTPSMVKRDSDRQVEEALVNPLSMTENKVNISTERDFNIPEGVEQVNIDNDPEIQSLYDSLVVHPFWEIPFDQIDLYVQLSEIVQEPNKYLGKAVATVGKILDKQSKEDKYALLLADPNVDVWAYVGENLFREGQIGNVISLHHAHVDLTDGERIILKQTPQSDYYIFSKIENKSANRNVI
mgnify:CR=1 FL=1